MKYVERKLGIHFHPDGNSFEITFMDSGREPKCAPNPAYPNGMEVDMSHGGRFCLVDVPYPAPRCGVMVVECARCGLRNGMTVAGRPDDPRRVKIGCKLN